MLHSICQQIWKTQQWPQDWKLSVFIPILKKGNAKESSDYCTIALTSHTSKVMLKILQARLQQYVNQELPDVQAGFRKGRGKKKKKEKKRQRNQRSNCQHPLDHRKSKRVPEKCLFLLYWIRQVLWLCRSQQTVENSERDGNTRPPDSASWEICMQVRKQQLELDMGKQTGSKLGKAYVKAVYCHHAYLTSIQSTSWKIPGWMKHKIESRLLGAREE